MYISRALEPVVRRYSEHFKAVVVTGPRQVGKTTMLKHLMAQDEEQGIERSYVTMDDTALRQLAVGDPALFLQRYKAPILIDEIQKAPELLPYIKMALDEAEGNGLFWLTGSQPFHLMRHVSESLAGRVGIIEMLGLSNAELAGTPSEPFAPSEDYFLRRVASMPAFDVREAFARIATGSLPAIRTLPPDLHAGGYESYIDTYVMRDIRDLAQVTDELKFRRFLSACAALTSRPVVYAELARLADIDEKTAKAWLSLLVSSYLVKVVPPYANSLVKRLTKQPIMHFTDVGLAAYLAGWTTPETMELGAMAGQLFETYAYSELCKSFVNAGQQAPFHFFRTSTQKEIDLLLEHDNMLFPIEVKKSASPTKGDARNFSALQPMSEDVADIPAALAAFKRDIGIGTVLCMAQDTFPISQNAWAFPVWAI